MAKGIRHLTKLNVAHLEGASYDSIIRTLDIRNDHPQCDAGRSCHALEKESHHVIENAILPKRCFAVDGFTGSVLWNLRFAGVSGDQDGERSK